MHKIPLFIFSIICALVACSAPVKTVETLNNKEEIATPVSFNHGVASGDPTSSSVIIWTRVTTEANMVKGTWEVSKDADFQSVVDQGAITTDESVDYTIKIDVNGLDANQKYFYRFEVESKYSPVGETKTLSDGDIEEVKLGVVSCSNWQWGYFSAYRHLANKDIDAVIHLGDYFYEHGPDGYGDKDFKRKHHPPNEVITLNDYRTRYAQYRTDKDLQLIHQKVPFISIWDDHEITNNAYKTGAENHQEDEGDYMERSAIARQVYYEWMPIRDNEDRTHYRSFDFGTQVDLIMLDERLEGRTLQPTSLNEVDENDMMLGDKQLAWFKEQLSQSDANWKIIGNQVIFSECDLSDVRPTAPKNLDAWDGYAFERAEIIEHITNDDVENVVFITGDTHTSWGFEVPVSRDDYVKTQKAVALELGTPSITSSNWDEYGNRQKEEVMAGAELVEKANPHLKYTNVIDHGYMILTLSDNEAKAEWYYLDDKKDASSGESLGGTATVPTKMNTLVVK